MRIKNKLIDLISPNVDPTGRVCGLQIDNKKLFITSDLHFNHVNIMKYCNRPWNNTDDMNEEIILRWNKKVPYDGITFILGDIALGGKSKAEKLAKMLSRLNSRKLLVSGNHDNYLFDSEECMEHLELLPPIVTLKVPDQKNFGKGGKYVVMSHYPLLTWDRIGHNSWMLHGHCHNSIQHKQGLIMDVGLDNPLANYAPFSYDDIKKYMSKREFVAVDHHTEETSYH